MDYSEVLIKVNQSVRQIHDALNKRDWMVVDIESDNLLFLVRQLRDSVADLK